MPITGGIGAVKPLRAVTGHLVFHALAAALAAHQTRQQVGGAAVAGPQPAAVLQQPASASPFLWCD